MPSANNYSKTIINSESTIDAFFRGKFYLIQPKKTAHRVGMDALLLASCVPKNFTGKVADFGSGCGGAGLAVIARLRLAYVTLVENAPEMIYYAIQTINYPKNKHLAERIKLINLDLNAAGATRNSAGLTDNNFDFVIMNPPFNQQNSQASLYNLKAHAHVQTTNLFEKWLIAAAACLKAKGRLAIIAKPESLASILKAMDKRYGAIEIIPIHPFSGLPAIRILIIATKGLATPLVIRPALSIRYRKYPMNKSQITAEMNNISNGLCSIYDI
ncbi:methyltransferase [Bartonella sp. TP]|uniref:tRNA1(Val) (adenine(37)-N6)-methyltransferase n=1 Tax=Bartonella sp. TP TaxID=3057550 RepID=UPI0025B0B35A|nr:methyltransferase [Bartonella sp. TP]WJW80213.1 methyltransferase [Bartonella sp. TP]